MRTKAPLWLATEVQQRILYWQDDLIVFNKPYDWPTSGHTLADEDCVQFHLIAYLASLGHPAPTPKFPAGMVWAVHQLDADTSGLLLLTTSRKKVSQYHQLLTAPETAKHYLAVVTGAPSWQHHSCTTPLGKLASGSHGPLPVELGGRTARTDFTVMQREADRTLLAVRLHTGRTHQIRLHLAELGHPLLGEDWYTQTPGAGHYRQALHACTIETPQLPQLPHIPLPDDLRGLLPG